MIRLNNTLATSITYLTLHGYKNTKKVGTFAARIKMYNKHLDRYDRQFHMRPPNLASKNNIQFPITVPLLVRHVYNYKKNIPKFQ
jgi:hypothetical protein